MGDIDRVLVNLYVSEGWSSSHSNTTSNSSPKRKWYLLTFLSPRPASDILWVTTEPGPSLVAATMMTFSLILFVDVECEIIDRQKFSQFSHVVSCFHTSGIIETIERFGQIGTVKSHCSNRVEHGENEEEYWWTHHDGRDEPVDRWPSEQGNQLVWTKECGGRTIVTVWVWWVNVN